MPYPPIKTENYKNIGGVNKKASPYMTGENEVIDILNFDYTQPGSYTVRPGSTGYGASIIGVTFINNPTRYNVSSLFQFARLTGASYLMFSNSNVIYSYNGTTTQPLLSQFSVPDLVSFAPLVDRLFIAGGNATFSSLQKSDGVNAWRYSLPPAQPPLVISSVTANFANAAIGVTGVYVYSFSYINERGFLGPTGTSAYTAVLGQSYGAQPLINPGFQIACGGTTQVAIFFQFANPGGLSLIPNGYGISYLCVFRAGPFATFQTSLPAMYDLSVQPIASPVYNDTCGNTLGVFDNTTGNTLYSTSLQFTLTPNYLNVYNNALFMSGFTSQPSTVYYSSFTDPELIGYTQSFQVRTNDSDVVTGMYNYLAQQMIFKNRSFHSVTGTTPPYPLNQISADYGCISNRAIVTFNSLLWFLDQKGIVQYDGANVGIISNREESIFKRMNFAAAKQQAVMIHAKPRNEVWTAIPIDGATFNNCLIVYDYVANAFSQWSGPQIASLIMGVDPNQAQAPIYGGFSGNINYFNAGLFTDNNNSFTCSVTPRYFGGQNHEMGYSVEKMFRRAYFDITDSNNTGQTTVMNVNFISDFGSSSVVQSQTFAMAAGFTQTRLDFGIPAKALSFQLSFVPMTAALNFNGYTIEYRYQRNV